MYHFTAPLNIIGVNPYVSVPADILESLFSDAGREKGPLPINGTVNGIPYTQTLVRYAGEWRLYINTTMLKDSPKRIGESIDITVSYDSKSRLLTIHPKLVKALDEHKDAKLMYESLSPSLQQEISRYLYKLKSEDKVDENVERAIRFLEGKERFLGRDPLKIHDHGGNNKS